MKQKDFVRFRPDRGAESISTLRSVVDTIIPKGENKFVINVAIYKN